MRAPHQRSKPTIPASASPSITPRVLTNTIAGAAIAAGFGFFSIWSGCAGPSPTIVSVGGPLPSGQVNNGNDPTPKASDSAQASQAPDTRACTKDIDCASGFCDRRYCRALTQTTSLGNTCDSPQGGQIANGRSFPCDGYLCLEKRCRSCQSDADCVAYYGAGRCVNVVGQHAQPGAVCWPMAKGVFDFENIPGSTEICAKTLADAPSEKRRAEGESCLRDCDCLSAFCDRGICANSADLGAWNYGKEGCEPGPPHSPIDNVLTAPVWDICAGYLCIEGRCRSCRSDAECKEGSSEYSCLSLYGLPGKRCGRPSEATFGTAPHRREPPPMPRAAPRVQSK